MASTRHALTRPLPPPHRAVELLQRYYEGQLSSLDEDEQPAAHKQQGSRQQQRTAAAAPGESQLLTEQVKPRTGLPPLLVNLAERPPEPLHYLGVSYGLTQQLYGFWRRAGFQPVYLRQSASEVTGEHTVVMLRPLNAPGLEVQVGTAAAGLWLAVHVCLMGSGWCEVVWGAGTVHVAAVAVFSSCHARAATTATLACKQPVAYAAPSCSCDCRALLPDGLASMCVTATAYMAPHQQALLTRLPHHLPQGDWAAPFVSDFKLRFSNLLPGAFRSMAPVMALSILDPQLGYSEAETNKGIQVGGGVGLRRGVAPRGIEMRRMH